MKAELSYKYSELDKRHEFGIEFIKNDDRPDAYIWWIFYYMGKYFGDFKPILYPFKRGKVINTYKCNCGADTTAKYIVNAINRKLEKAKKIRNKEA